MAETPPRYRAILTNAAFETEARALAASAGIVLTKIAVGDANNEFVEPSPDATALLHEVWRHDIDSKEVDPNDPNITNVMMMIPADVGGFWIREVGVYGHIEGETEEFLYIYANHAPYYKMLPIDGQSVTHELIVPVVQTGNVDVTIQVADLGYVTRAEYRQQLLKQKLLLAQIEANLIATMERQVKFGLGQIKTENRLTFEAGEEA